LIQDDRYESETHLYRIICLRRSIRQFKPESVTREILTRLVNAARLAPSAANLQPLEFIVVDEESLRRKIFPCLKWAAYISPEGNPRPGHEPTAYVIVLVNLDIRNKDYERDVGAAVENMILTGMEEGVGSCWILSSKRDTIRRLLRIPRNFRIDSVIALGYPGEDPVVEEAKESIKYWKDNKGRLHVPKRKLEDILHFNCF